MHYLIYVGMALLACACVSRHKKSVSDSAYATQKIDAIFGSPSARIRLIDAPIPTSFAELRVCVESAASAVPEALLLESKLAILTWLMAMVPGEVQSYFERFSFAVEPSCDDLDPKLSYIVRMTERGGLTPFPAVALVCKKTQVEEFVVNTGCTTKSHNAHAGPGKLVTHFLRQAPDKWTKVDAKEAGVVLLNGEIAWHSLADELKLLAASNSDPRIATLIELYEGMKAPEEQSLQNLGGMVSLLQNTRLTASGDGALSAAINEAQKVLDVGAEKSFSYRPALTTYHVLLHEWGHVFGLDHPDQLSPGTIYGQVSATDGAAQISYDTRGLTKDAAMAYGEPIMFLTADDSEGARQTHSKLQEQLDRHLNP